MEHLANRVARDDRVDSHLAVGVHRHMDRIRVAEQIVQVAEDFLVGSDQKRRQVVGRSIVAVEEQRFANVAAVDEPVDLPVRIAGHVGHHGMVQRLFVEPVNRHDREELLDGPTVGHRLEQREVAEVRFAEQRVEVLQFLGHVFRLLEQPGDLAADRPEKVFRLAALFQRQVTAIKQPHRHVERLLRVVIAFEQVADRQIAVGVAEDLERLLDLAGERRGDEVSAAAGCSQDVEDEHAVVGDEGSAALGEDRRMRHAGVVADALHVEDDVVGVFLERVVGARFEVGLRPVVVDPQPAADIEILQARAMADQVHVDPAGFIQRRLDVADVRDLASHVEMQQPEAIGHRTRLEQRHGTEQFADGQAEFRTVAARRLPASRTAGGKLDPHADHRPDADLLGDPEDQLQFGESLDDQENPPPDLVGQQRRLDESLVLEAVADDRHVVLSHRDYGQQLGLAARFQPVLLRPAEPQDFFHDLALLVDLDRIQAAVLPAIIMLSDRLRKRVADGHQPVLENVGETQQHGRLDSPGDEPIDKQLQVDGAVGRPGRMNRDVARRVHRKIAISPAGDVIGLRRFGDRPAGNEPFDFQHGHIILREGG